jgi:peptidyl-tRNA hydrolase
MSTGKAAAQAGHAAVEAYKLTPDNNTKRMWHCGGHYAKIVLEAPSAEFLLYAERYINDRGFKTALIIDEGRTEIDKLLPTALGVEVLDKDNSHVAATFSVFDLYKDKRPPPPEPAPEPVSGWDALKSECKRRFTPLLN